MILAQTSRDVLNLVIAASVFGLAFFTCWVIFYLAMILRQVLKATEEMRGRFNKIDELIDAIREKIDHSTSYLSLIGEGIKKLVVLAKKYSDKKEKSTGKKRNVF